MSPARQASSPPVLGGDVLSFLEALNTGGAQRLEVARTALGTQLEGLVTNKVLRVLDGLLGPVVALGPVAFKILGVPVSMVRASGATDQVALRDAIILAHSRGFRVLDVFSKYVALRDQQGREHLLYIRISDGTPNTSTVGLLLKKHKPTLQRGRGTLILYTLDPAKYKFQQKFRPELQVWEAVQ